MNRKVLAVLCAAQFLMVLDQAVMNVSISQLVSDFDTTVTRIQMAITFYALVMAAFMITGGKIGDRIGRKRAFRIGLVVYAVGSALTAMSWSVGSLIVGWSVIEGLGAALVMPAMIALVAGNFTGSQRAMAYGVLGGVSGAGIAVGPILGGWVTTNLSWRYVFWGEVVVAVFIVAGTVWLTEVAAERRPKIDVVGAALSAVGLGLLVYGVLQASTWGFISPSDSPIEPFGLSLAPFVVGAGAVLLGLFVKWQRHLESVGREPLVHLDNLRIAPVRAGMTMYVSQNLILMGVFFVVPVYLQVVQGFDALQTGVRMLPVSITLFATSAIGPKLAQRYSPRVIVKTGLFVMLVATVALLALVDPDIANTKFFIAMGVLGVGIGLLVSQLGNVIQSSIGDDARSEVAGVQLTAQQTGGAFGTALIGAVVLASLGTAFTGWIAKSPEVSEATRSAVSVSIDGAIAFIPTSQATAAMEQAGLPASDVESIAKGYSDAQLQALRIGLFVVAAIVVFSLFKTAGLPTEPLVGSGAGGGARAPSESD